jgi:hypothetical protein
MTSPKSAAKVHKNFNTSQIFQEKFMLHDSGRVDEWTGRRGDGGTSFVYLHTSTRSDEVLPR